MAKKRDWFLIAIFIWIACSVGYILYLVVDLIR